MVHWGASRAEPQDTELAAAAVAARGTVERCTVERFALRCDHLNGTDSSVGASAQWDFPHMVSAGVGWLLGRMTFGGYGSVGRT